MAKDSILPSVFTKKYGEGSLVKFGKSMSFQFAMMLTACAILSFSFLFYVIRVLAQLDIAFFEANGMISNVDLRQAFLIEIFRVDSEFYFLAFGGIAAVGVISYIFTRSQLHYFTRLTDCMKEFSETGNPPDATGLGSFSPHAQSFFKVMSMKMRGEDQTKIDHSLEMIEAVWPRKPQVSWLDQGQFVAVSAAIAVIYSAAGVIFFIQVTKRVIELSNQLIRFHVVTGPNYFSVKQDLSEMIIWPVFLIAAFLFVASGYRLGRRLSDATYAILRDLRVFMAKDINQKLFLRRGDPGQEQIESLNQSLDKIRRKVSVRQ